jgi:hypothetical protein
MLCFQDEVDHTSCFNSCDSIEGANDAMKKDCKVGCKVGCKVMYLM